MIACICGSALRSASSDSCGSVQHSRSESIRTLAVRAEPVTNAISPIIAPRTDRAHAALLAG